MTHITVYMIPLSSQVINPNILKFLKYINLTFILSFNIYHIVLKATHLIVVYEHTILTQSL